MPSLRATSGLSTLALLIGIIGTAWLSGLTSRWHEPSDRVAMVRHAHVTPRNLSTTHHQHRPASMLQPRRTARNHITRDGTTQAAASAPPAVLQPLTTPADSSQTWDQLRGHLDGRVIVQVQVGADGRVGSASVAASSGDPILDRHALRSVRGWRFVVPPGHPDGLNGELAMQFSSRDRTLGMR